MAKILKDFLKEDEISWMKDSQEERYCIHPLSKEIAEAFGEELATIESLVPNTTPWTKEDVTTEIRAGKELKNKWNLSVIVCAEDFSSIIGVNFAHEMKKELPTYPEDIIYLHRGAILEEFRKRRVGLGMVGLTWENAIEFMEGKAKYQNNEFPIRFQTNDSPENISKIRLYEGLGAIKIGKKKYPDKVDWVFGINKNNFFKSPLFKRYNELKTK